MGKSVGKYFLPARPFSGGRSASFPPAPRLKKTNELRVMHKAAGETTAKKKK